MNVNDIFFSVDFEKKNLAFFKNFTEKMKEALSKQKRCCENNQIIKLISLSYSDHYLKILIRTFIYTYYLILF